MKSPDFTLKNAVFCYGLALLLIPVENHLEQYLNACDAERTGIGLHDSAFQLSRLLDPPKGEATAAFRQWVDQAEAIAMRVVESAVGTKGETIEVVSPVLNPTR